MSEKEYNIILTLDDIEIMRFTHYDMYEFHLDSEINYFRGINPYNSKIPSIKIHYKHILFLQRRYQKYLNIIFLNSIL